MNRNDPLQSVDLAGHGPALACASCCEPVARETAGCSVSTESRDYIAAAPLADYFCPPCLLRRQRQGGRQLRRQSFCWTFFLIGFFVLCAVDLLTSREVEAALGSTGAMLVLGFWLCSLPVVCWMAYQSRRAPDWLRRQLTLFGLLGLSVLVTAGLAAADLLPSATGDTFWIVAVTINLIACWPLALYRWFRRP